MSDKLLTGAVVYRKQKSQLEWLLTKSNEKDNKWEIPKDTVRRGESSVGAVIRFLGENLGVPGRVIEEAGRTTSSRKTSNGTTLEEKSIFYLIASGAGGREMVERVGRQVETKWFSTVSANKKIVSAQERRMLKQAKDVLKEWQKNKAA